jgi:transposase
VRELDKELCRLTAKACPALLGIFGAGSDTAGALLLAAGDNPERLRSEAAFAKLTGVSPVQASSGKTTRHRLNHGGDRHANAALHRIVLVRPQMASPTDDRLRREADRRRQVQAGDHPVSQTVRGSRGLPGSDRRAR